MGRQLLFLRQGMHVLVLHIWQPRVRKLPPVAWKSDILLSCDFACINWLLHVSL